MVQKIVVVFWNSNSVSTCKQQQFVLFPFHCTTEKTQRESQSITLSLVAMASAFCDASLATLHSPLHFFPFYFLFFSFYTFSSFFLLFLLRILQTDLLANLKARNSFAVSNWVCLASSTSKATFWRRVWAYACLLAKK